MKKLGIFAYPRSGSSLLYQILKDHVSHDGHLNEVFNPSERNLIIREDDSLKVEFFSKEHYLDPDKIQTREERLDLMKEFNHKNFFIKVLSMDTMVPGIVEYLAENYKFVTIERRNPFDTVLSSLIATKYWYFNYSGDGAEPVPDYKPFVAEHSEFTYIRTAIRRFYNLKEGTLYFKTGPLSFTENNFVSSLIYEDIIGKSRGEILEMAGFPGIDDDRELPLRKLLTFEEKCGLIENLDEVAQWYQEELTFFLPHIR